MTALLLSFVLAQANVETDGFTRPLALEGPAARECGECHPAIFESWQRSFHRQSLTSAHFLDGFAAEPQTRCLLCHAPLQRQARETTAQRQQLARGEVSSLAASARAHEGITCITCHLRDGEVMAPNAAALPYAHRLRHAPRMKTSEFCGDCHEFAGHAVLNGRTVLNDLPMQTTLSEWRAWGGQKTCQDCHMPGASHEVRGAHDVAFLRGSVTLSVAGRVATVVARHVGHRVPTGDVFRHLVLWADDTPLAEFGLTLDRGHDAAGRPGVVVVKDTRLLPDSPVTVRLPPSARRVRLTFHYGEVSARQRVGLAREDLIVELHSLAL